MRVFLLIFLIMITGVCKAQQYDFKETEQTINGLTHRGQQVSVQLDVKNAEKAWKSYLSQHAGKVKSSKGVYTVEEAKISAISTSPMRIISTVNSNEQGCFVWWCLDMGVSYVDEKATPAEYTAAKNFMENFARELYREDILKQINKAEETLAATKEEQDRVVKQANDIQLSIERNKKHRLELEGELQKNSEELQQLELSAQHNIEQQELSRQQVQEMSQKVEAIRVQLQKIQ